MKKLSISDISPEKAVGRLCALGLHTVAVYLSAIHLFPWLAGRFFIWVVPFFRISSESTGDWYLHHLEIISVVPALVLGYVSARHDNSVAVWAWVVPTVVLAYKMLRYEPVSSVLLGSSTSTFKYFFDIQPSMPTLLNPVAGDPIRLLAQLTITAPFYSGVAYSLGAWVSKRKVLRKCFSFRSDEQ